MTLTFKDNIPHGAQAGIVILKKIPRGHQRQPDHLKAEGSTIPDFKPIKAVDSGYSFPGVVTKLFSASSSLQPDGQPTAEHTTDDDNYEKLPPKEHKDNDEYSGPPPVQETDIEPAKPSSPYYDSLTNQRPNTFSTTDFNNYSSEKYKESTKFTQLNEIEAIKSALKLQTVSENQNIPAKIPPASQQNLPSKPEDLPSIDSFGPYPGPLPPDFVAKYELGNQGFTLPSFPVPPLDLANLQGQTFDGNAFNSKNNAFQTSVRFRSPTPVDMKPPRAINPAKAPPFFSRHPTHVNVPYSPEKGPTKQRHHTRQVPTRQKGPYDVVKSVSYELTPNGPVKL